MSRFRQWIRAMSQYLHAVARLLSTSEGTHLGAFRPADWGLLLVPGVIWGSSFYFIAEGLESFEPGLITFLRVMFGFATLSAFPAVRRQIDRADWPRIAVLALTWFAFPLSMFPYAEERVSSSLTGMLNGATPLFVAAVATVLLGRLPGRYQIIGLAIGFTGVLLIAAPSLGEGTSSAVGVLLVLLALASYGVSFNLLVPLQQRYGSLPVLWRAQAIAIVLTAPLGLAGIPGSHLQTGPLLAIVALGALGTGVAYVLAGALAGRVGATRASVTTYLIPVVALILGVVLRDEPVAVLSIVGSAVVLSGAWLTSRSDAPPANTLRPGEVVPVAGE
jgi:drug/metabolite transporter (DMT)-like permease